MEGKGITACWLSTHTRTHTHTDTHMDLLAGGKRPKNAGIQISWPQIKIKTWDKELHTARRLRADDLDFLHYCHYFFKGVGFLPLWTCGPLSLASACFTCAIACLNWITCISIVSSQQCTFAKSFKSSGIMQYLSVHHQCQIVSIVFRWGGMSKKQTEPSQVIRLIEHVNTSRLNLTKCDE